MKNSPVRKLVGLLGAVGLALPCLGQAGWDRPLNVLIVITDQHNAHALGHTSNGFGGVQSSLTPNLDALAAQGTRFDAAFCVTPQCSPSRFSIITGRWPHDHGLRWNGMWEPQGAVTFPRLARDAGYVTGTIGKNHFNWLSQPAPLGEDHGFDVIIDENEYLAYCMSQGTPTYAAPGRTVTMPSFRNERDGGNHLPRAGYTLNENHVHPAGYWADQAIEFLDQRAGPQGDDKPFFLLYSMVGPHTPILPTGPAAPQDWAHAYHPFEQLGVAPNFDKVSSTSRLSYFQGLYATVSMEQHQEVLSYYYGYINQIDWNVGRVLDRLDALGIADETVVLFTTDHGEMATEMGCWTKGAGHYDSLTRVPVIVRLPGAVEPGAVSGALVSNLDLMPTLLELTGVPIEPADRARLAGESLVPILTGAGTPAAWRDTVFVEQGDPRDALFPRLRSARTATTKYTFDEMRGGEEEFYDLALDPWELDNLIASPAHAQEIAALRGALDAWWGDEVGHAPWYEVTGNLSAPPVAASAPLPADGTQGVPRDVDPAWLPSTSADSIEVYLGTSPTALELVATLPAMSDRFNPGTLAPSCEYFWRVDSVNANGVAEGTVWSFRTGEGPYGPGLAALTAPADRAQNVSLAPMLKWTTGQDVVLHELFLGPAGTLESVTFLGGQMTSYSPTGLQAGVTYEWRLDAYHPDGHTEGTVWSFTTDASGLPDAATAVQPFHLAHVELTEPFALDFLAGAGATSHDVYFGTELPPAFQGNQTTTSFVPSGLVAGATYYWRVDEVNASGTRRGFTWSFTLE